MIKIYSAATSLGSFNQGTELAPRAIVHQNLVPALKKNRLKYDIQESIELFSAGLGSNSKLRYHQALVDYNRRFYRQIIESTTADDLALTVGGDHSVAIATMFASKLRHSDAVVVYIDAHPDCSSPDTTLTGNIHGMSLATVLGDAIYRDFEYPSFGYNEVFLIGIKDADKDEADYLNDNSIFYIAMDNIIERGIAECLKEVKSRLAGRPVHVSLDIDSIDSLSAPGTGIINKGGLSFREISYLCRHLSTENIIAIDIVEVNPSRDIDSKTQHLATELAVNLLKGEWSEYMRYLLEKH